MYLSRKNQQGAGLIEMLVALTLLAIGLLGVLGMQSESAKSSRKAHFASTAHILAHDMAERIYAYDDVDITTDNDDFGTIDTSKTLTDPKCSASGCSLVEQIQLAAWEWKQSFNQLLPAGRGQTSFNAANSIYTITVMWDNENTGATGTNCSGNTATDLTCYQIEVAL